MDAGEIGELFGSVVGAVLIPIAVFVLLRNLLGLTPLKHRVGVVHGIAAPIALFSALAPATAPAGALFALLGLLTTAAFIVWSYRKAKAAAGTGASTQNE